MSGVAAALLAGCGAAQPPIVEPGAASQNNAVAGHRDRHETGSTNDLIYVAGVRDTVYMLDYSTGQLVGKFNPPSTYVSGMCTDSAGDVYVTGWSGGASEIIRYSHGATQPSENIIGPGYTSFGCSVDPTTGNLALLAGDSDGLWVDRFLSGSDSPDPIGVSYEPVVASSCAYDDDGNLFVDYHTKSGAYRLAELAAGAKTFTQLSLNRGIKMGQLFWASSYLAVGYPGGIYHVQISGSNASVIGRTQVQNGKPVFSIHDGNTLIEPYGKDGKQIGFWQYPQGGKAIRTVRQVDKRFKETGSVAVSD
jgi:WD40 repeat protein